MEVLPSVPGIIPHFEVIQDISGHSASGSDLTNFVSLFNDRLMRIGNILRKGKKYSNLMPIESIRRTKLKEATFIGMVNEVSRTKNGHLWFEMEDEKKGFIRALLNAEHPRCQDTFLPDDVLAMEGRYIKQGPEDFFVVKEVDSPGMDLIRNPTRSKMERNAVFISDIHLGADNFCYEEWDDFIAWLRGEHELVGNSPSRVDYLVIAGDVVDGVGIYPDQQYELDITDLYEQYRELARSMSRIPEHIEVIIQPGNHDACRLPEPQPMLPEDVTSLFPERFTFVGNPVELTLDGVRVLSYHGRSMDDLNQEIPGMSYEEPHKTMIQMLERRHLVPVFGKKVPIAPEEHDFLTIERQPEIFVTGHTHGHCAVGYKGSILLNCSTWQGQTTFQKKVGLRPVPCKANYVNLHTGDFGVLDFQLKGKSYNLD